MTPLNWAAHSGQLEMVRELLNKGAKVDPVDKKGQSPLMFAAGNGHLEIVQELLKHGADVNRADKSGHTALSLVNEKHTAIKNLLREEKWKAEAKQRIKKRTQTIAEVAAGKSREWSNNESIMRKKAHIGYLESINRLELRYPKAVPEEEQAFQEVITQLRNLDIKRRGKNAEEKRDATFRYLENHSEYDFLGSGLTRKQMLSLAWAAIQDRNFFHSQQEVEDRTWGLMEALANIQRAHNDCGTGAIDWKNGEDKPSCTFGEFIRLLEHLDNLHPDVKINSEILISVQMTVDAIRSEHQHLRQQISDEKCQQIKTSFQSSDKTSYHEYLNQLRESVRSTYPAISLGAINNNLAEEMMEALFDMPGWEDCSRSISQAVCHTDNNSNRGLLKHLKRLRNVVRNLSRQVRD
jgi:hypothetical protein